MYLRSAAVSAWYLAMMRLRPFSGYLVSGNNLGPSAFYWMTEIAALPSILSAAQINGIPTNVNVESGEIATPEGLVEVVIKSVLGGVSSRSKPPNSHS
jgi:hypothetical protein